MSDKKIKSELVYLLFIILVATITFTVGVYSYKQSTAKEYGVSNVSYQTYERIDNLWHQDNGDGTTTVCVNVWTSSGRYPDFLNIWIDYNNNSIFDTNDQVVNEDYYFFSVNNSQNCYLVDTPKNTSTIRAELGYYVDPKAVDEWLYRDVVDKKIPEFSFGTFFLALLGSLGLFFVLRKKK